MCMAEDYPKIYLYKRMVQAKLFMDEHFCEKIDLNNIADEACFSKFHFIRLFKSIYGITPHQYLIRTRIEKSMEMLQSGHTVSATCLGVGFESLSSFTGLFGKYTKLSPSAFRKQYLTRIANIQATPLHYIPNCFSLKKGWTENSNSEETPH